MNKKLQRIDSIFDKELKDIIRERYSKGMDDKPAARAIVQRKVIRHPNWIKMKLDLINVKFLPEDKKGQVLNLFSFIALVILIVVFFGALIYVSGIMTNTFHTIGLNNDLSTPSTTAGYVNLTQAADNTFGQMNQGIQALRLVALTIIFSMAMSILLGNFLIKVHPAFFIVYIFIAVIAVIFSAPVSNSYQSLLQTNLFDGGLLSFVGANYIIINLPTFVAVVAIFGAIILFVNIIRSENEGVLK